MAEKIVTKKTLDGGDGGTAEAPRSINVVEYAGARAREMEAMAAVSRRTWGNNKALQTIPRHMRRRAASHNVKRLPRRLQGKGRREMELSGKPTKMKAPSRRHRRRPSNLLEEYSRRARQNVWLETHIWHAKRFHMSTQWGYRVPLHPNDKGLRSSYRGAARFCIMRDISYMCCIEIQGPQASILDGLIRLCSVETGPTPGAARYLRGTREGAFVLFRHDEYPSGALGVVKFLWRPEPDDNPHVTSTTHRQMWMWVHPACYEDMLTELKTVFKLEEGQQTEESMQGVESVFPLEKGETKVAKVNGGEPDKQSVKNGHIKRTVDDIRPSPLDAVCYTNGEITLTSLKDLLCRFNLTGPLSHSILQDLLKVADVTGTTDEQTNSGESELDTNLKIEPNGKATSDTTEKWWQQHFSDAGNRSIHVRQQELWHQLQGLQSAGELADNVILALTVRDPRIFLPKKKTRVADDPSAASETTLEAVKVWPTGVAHSPIWHKDVRLQVKDSKVSESAMNELRSKQLVPGTELQLGDEESRIPVLIIQHPGPRLQCGQIQERSSQAGVPLQWGAGWDIVLPQAWAMAFWIGLVYRGARACGLKESLSTATEMGQLHFPEGFPDMPTGITTEYSDKAALEAKYKRMPPAKRPNYVKLGTVAPFHYPWPQLISDWVSSSEVTSTAESSTQEISAGKTVVLRNKRLLQNLDKLCSGSFQQQPRKGRKLSQVQKSVHDVKVNFQETVLSALEPHYSCLVAVHVRALQRGVLEPFSMICFPRAEDLQALREDKNYAGPLEPPHKDPTPKNHKQKQAKRNKDVGKCAQETSGANSQQKGQEVEKVKKTKGLCEEVTTVSNSSSRPVVGFVKQGGYHFCEGRGAGVGFVVVEGLRTVLQSRCVHDAPTIVLVRSPRSNQYRFAYLSILC